MSTLDPLIANVETALLQSGDRHARAQRIADLIRQHGQFRWVGLYDVDWVAEEVSNLAWSGSGPPAHPVFHIGLGLTGTALSARATVNVGDVTKDSRYLTAFASTRSEIIVPIVDTSGTPIGTLDVESERADAFTPDVQQRLESCARAIASLWSTPDGIGPVVSGPSARRPERVVMEGDHVRLVPLDPAAHGESLFDAAHGEDRDRLWRYLSDGPYPDRDSFLAEVQRKALSSDAIFFTIIRTRDGVARGYASYMRIEPDQRVIEVGNILYTPELQGTTGATEAMYLMARHVFEDLGYRRYEWKCNALNLPSRSAALRLGFAFEGIFRQHMIVKGRNRDTAWYSMLDREWPSRKSAFERWLAPDNFDLAGRQRQSLAALRGDTGH